MCGIVAYSGKTGFDKNKVKILFLYNESRGEQAAGIYSNEGELDFKDRVFKTLGKASEKLLPSYNFVETTAMIGHTRKSSTGASDDIRNVHPFVFDNVIGVHNGTFSNYSEVRNAFEMDKDRFPVDSKVLYGLIDETNDEQTAVGYFEGGAALVFVKKDDPDTLHVYRNSERPLFRGTCKDANGDNQIYISSIREALSAIECSNIKEFTEGMFYTITNGKVICTNKKPIKKELPKVISIKKEVQVIEEFVYKVDNEEVYPIPNNPYAYTKATTFTDGSMVVDNKYTSIAEKVKKVETIYCPNRLGVFSRIYIDLEKGYFIEARIPDSLIMGERQETIADNLVDSSYHSTYDLLIEMYSSLSELLCDLLEARLNGNYSNIDENILQSNLFRMETFLSIVTD